MHKNNWTKVLGVFVLFVIALGNIAVGKANAQDGAEHTITFINKTGETIWVGGLSNAPSNIAICPGGGGTLPLPTPDPPWQPTPTPSGSPTPDNLWKIEADDTETLTIPFCFTAGRFWARTGCVANGDGLSCATGDCLGKANCDSSASGVTVAEFTMDGGCNIGCSGDSNSVGQDNYDVSLVSGFNVLISVKADASPPPISSPVPSPSGVTTCTGDDAISCLQCNPQLFPICCPDPPGVGGCSNEEIVGCNTQCITTKQPTPICGTAGCSELPMCPWDTYVLSDGTYATPSTSGQISSCLPPDIMVANRLAPWTNIGSNSDGDFKLRCDGPGTNPACAEGLAAGATPCPTPFFAGLATGATPNPSETPTTPGGYCCSPVDCVAEVMQDGACSLISCHNIPNTTICDPYGQCNSYAAWPTASDMTAGTAYLENVTNACQFGYAWAFDDATRNADFNCFNAAGGVGYTITFGADTDGAVDGNNNDSSGCSIASAGASLSIPFLLIPIFIVIMRSWRRNRS